MTASENDKRSDPKQQVTALAHSVNVCDALALVECNILLVVQALNLDERGVVVLVHLRPVSENERQGHEGIGKSIPQCAASSSRNNNT